MQTTKTFSETYKGNLISVEVTVNSQEYFIKTTESEKMEYRLRHKYEAKCSFGNKKFDFEGYNDTPGFDDIFKTDEYAQLQANNFGKIMKDLIEKENL